jgi:hypothetical protein
MLARVLAQLQRLESLQLASAHPASLWATDPAAGHGGPTPEYAKAQTGAAGQSVTVADRVDTIHGMATNQARHLPAEQRVGAVSD